MRTQLRQLKSMKKQSGQTLILAILILGVLLIIGFAFAGIISQNITFSGKARQRTVSSDLSEAGIRYAHYQMLNSELGADWRPQFTPLQTDINGNTKDPDALYLRAGTGFPLRGAADPLLDRGGPDGLGPYTRVNFEKGRSLVRVRFAPSDFVLFGSPNGALREPGRAKNYTIIESIGRPGKVNPNDPSTLLSENVQVAGFGNANVFRAQYARLKKVDSRNAFTRKLMAFASIGIIESARYITNLFNVSRPAEIGALSSPVSNANASGADKSGIGVTYEGQPVQIPTQLGGRFITSVGMVIGSGSIWSNAPLDIHGRIDTFLNVDLGDMFAVAGDIRAINDASQVNISRIFYNRTTGLYDATWGGRNTLPAPAGLPWRLSDNQAVGTDNPLSSSNGGFATVGGAVRDGNAGIDTLGYSRLVGTKAPPSIQRLDPATNTNRYTVMTRQSGAIFNGRNVGAYGYGRGIFVDSNERGNLPGEEDRETVEVGKALVFDWLNPNNSSSQAWQGPFYRPLAASLKLLPDGFIITRNSRSAQRYWRLPSGQIANTSSCRFRIRTIGNQTYILNSIVLQFRGQGNLIDSPALSNNDFLTYGQPAANAGQPFSGVLLFDGDVSVRGVIPTNQQITVVSNGSIYINGSITKGVVTENGASLNQPSRSTCALLARDYVALNTTQFFGPAPGEDPQPKNADSLPNTPNAVELDLSDAPNLTLNSQFLLDPLTPPAQGGNPANPQTWRPYAMLYTAFGGGSLDPQLLLTESADDNGPAFIQLGVAPLTFADAAPPANLYTSYLFSRDIAFGAAGTIPFNAAGSVNIFPTPGKVPILGLGNPATNAYPKFETVANPVVHGFGAASFPWTFGNRKMLPPANNPEGDYQIASQDETALQIKLSSAGLFAPKNYELARVAVTPHDIRIEAALYAEEGSFFVIPGPWFNYNTDDTRDQYLADVQAFIAGGSSQVDAEDLARRKRFETFGTMPEAPFYGEPLDVRISIIGAISENMPPPIAQQAEWQKKWGWIPRYIGATGQLIPTQHVPSGYNLTGATPDLYVPNLILTYDPALATDTSDGVTPLRVNNDGWVLPPMPRLPVSPTLAYFGEVTP